MVTLGTITAQSVSPVTPVYGNLDARIEAMLAESTSPPAAAMPNLAMNEVSLPTALPLIVNCQPLVTAVNPPPVTMGSLLSVALPPEDNLVTPVDRFPELSDHGRTGLSCLLDLPGEEDFKPDYSDLEIEEEVVVANPSPLPVVPPRSVAVRCLPSGKQPPGEPEPIVQQVNPSEPFTMPVAPPRSVAVRRLPSGKWPLGEAEPRVQQNNPPEHSTLERALTAHTDALRESTEATKANTAMMTKYMTAFSKQSTENQKHVVALTELSLVFTRAVVEPLQLLGRHHERYSGPMENPKRERPGFGHDRRRTPTREKPGRRQSPSPRMRTPPLPKKRTSSSPRRRATPSPKRRR